MGGHRGLNILPQKRWNVYNFNNREKVCKDEEAAAKEKQLKHDTEFCIEQLRQARGLASASSSRQSPSVAAEPAPSLSTDAEPKSRHINLFEGIRIFDPVEVADKSKGELGDEKRKGYKRMKKEAEAPKLVLPEDEKYRLGYGMAGKGIKLSWYMEKRLNSDAEAVANDDDCDYVAATKRSRKKSLKELREERLKRETGENEMERALLLLKGCR